MVDIEKCFPAGFTDEKVDKVKVDWRKVVFDDVACGDCLMMMLVAGRDWKRFYLQDAPSRKWESWSFFRELRQVWTIIDKYTWFQLSKEIIKKKKKKKKMSIIK